MLNKYQRSLRNQIYQFNVALKYTSTFKFVLTTQLFFSRISQLQMNMGIYKFKVLFLQMYINVTAACLKHKIHTFFQNIKDDNMFASPGVVRIFLTHLL